MPGLLLHVGATATCPHGMGQLSIVSSNSRVLVGGQPVATTADTGLIAACTFAPGGKPQMCVRVQWLVESTRVTVMGAPALLQTGTHLCQSADQVPNGPPIISVCQSRVVGQ